MNRFQIPPRIFLSYAHEDQEVAQPLADELKKHGAEVWIDVEEIAPGDSLKGRIEAAIQGSDLFLVLVSPASEHSAWLRRELESALATTNRTRVVPVLLSGAAVPADLRDVLYVEADPENLGQTTDQILRASHRLTDEKSDAAEVERILSGLEVAWQREPSIAGVRPDFLVEASNGMRVVVEVKGRPNPGLIELVDARTQAVRIRDLTGADAAIVVLPQAKAGMPDAGIVSLANLELHLRSLLASASQRSPAMPRRPDPTPSGNRRTVFASMPFKPQYEDVYWFAMAAAAEAIDATCVRVDREDFDGDISARITSDIESAVAVIADMSESNPDVLYEVGYARRHGTPCVQICSTSLEDLPFNVRNVNTLAYRLGQIHALRNPLAQRLKSVAG